MTRIGTLKLTKLKILLLVFVMIIGIILPLNVVDAASSVSEQDATMTVKWNLKKHTDWNNKFNQTGLKIKIKDTDGNNIKLDNSQKTKTITIDDSYTDTEVENIKPSINGYTFSKAVVVTTDQEIAFTALAPWYEQSEGGYFYDYKDGTRVFKDTLKGSNYKQNYEVVFYYVENKTLNKLETIETVDSTSLGIDLKVYDYDASTVNKKSNLKFGTSSDYKNYWNINHNDSITAGIVKNTLEYDESSKTYNDPSLSNTITNKSDGKDGNIRNSSLAYLFSDNNEAKNANHLFKMKDGYYYYNSDENYAYFNNTGDFSVYTVAGSPSNSNVAAYKNGNFFPFNKLGVGAEYLGKTSSGSELYNFTTGDGATSKNVHFGMTMDTMFIQPKDGKVDNEDMVFEFAGDDDVWVYIDGVLVLDIGGIHAAQSGSINFATGETKVSNSTDLNGNRISSSNSLYEIMSKVKDDEYMEENFIKNENGNWVFKNYTDHNIKFYYLERGAGASNCKLKFNIQSVPKDSIKVTKQVENINEGSFSDVEFEFKLYLETSENNGDNIINVDGVNYKLYIGSETDNNGIFKLKHGETKTFDKIADAGTKYVVQEIGLNQDEYDEVKVDGTAYNPDSGNITGNEGNYIVTTKPQIVGSDVSVIFYNRCNANNWHDIIINKKMSNGLSVSDSFKMKVEIGGQAFSGKYTINGIEKNAGSDGIIEMKAGDIVIIGKIAAGTSFKVSEVDLDDNKFEVPDYKFDGANAKEYKESGDSLVNQNSIASKIILKKNAEVTVTNTAKPSKLTIVKKISQADFANGDPIFTFKISNEDGSLVLYRTVRFTKDSFVQNTENIKSVTIEGLPVGNYTVEELNTVRYTLDNESLNPASVKLEDINGTTVYFKNNLTNDDDFSHTDVLENKFTIKDGSITITQEKHTKGVE